MNIFTAYKELFRRYALTRAITWLILLASALVIATIVGKNVKKYPQISQITPAVGSPGDIMVITGSNFGGTRDTSYVEIAGSRITASGYLEWSDTRIRIILPANVQDGLVFVGTSAGRSEPSFFANEKGIPVAVQVDPNTTRPTIDSISPSQAHIGEIITITGSNFGSSRGTSKVLFTAKREDVTADSKAFIPASETDYDYISWSDKEIQVKIPDGAGSGHIYIKTAKGESQQQSLTVTFPAGSKTYGTIRTYVVQLTADIQNPIEGQEATVTLYMPRPPVTSAQSQVDLTECHPEPFIKDDIHDIIYQQQLSKIQDSKKRFSQNFVVSVCSVTSDIKPSRVTRYTDEKNLLYKAYTGPDNCVPANNEQIITLAQSIIGKEKNPYNKAKLIYDYMIKNYTLINQVRSGDASVLDLLRTSSGDAYDFAIVFTALCRSAGIPAVPISGILVENDSRTRNHWWTEIYFENYGWFPVDIALGAGLNYRPFTQVENPEKYYFGNMDSQHIVFSRGWNQIKTSLLNSRTVYRPRTYALQSIWEEVSSTTTNYSSLWNNPIIMGIY